MHRGSTWHIWDFHLHTPCSVLNSQFGNPDDDATWDRYIDAIERKTTEAGIVAIGITDYFTIEGYKRVCRYQQEGRLQNLLIFPNIEFRVDTVVYRSRDRTNPKRLNFHVLFSPDLPINLIEEHFLHDLDFTHQDHPFEPAQVRKLKLSNLEDFGAMLLRQEPRFQDSSSLKVAYTTAMVQIDRIKKRLEEDGRFQGKYLLVLANEDLSLMEWGSQDHAIRQHLIQMSHMLFSSNPSDRDFCLGKLHNSLEAFIDEFKSPKPCIWGCDSHSFEERFLEPDEERYCWIKSEVSWEGLKQILYEPEDRVKIQASNPEPPKSYFTLDSLQVDGVQVNNALRIDDLNIKLNSNLVALIGGRGSGKTALLDLIAICFPEGRKLFDLHDSFYHRVYATNERQVENVQPVSISLRFRSGDEFTKQVGQEKNVFEQADVLYLTQNHMEDYTANPAKLYEHIVDLVFDKSPDQRQGYDELQGQARQLQRRIQSLNLEIEQLREQVDSKSGEEQAEYAQKQGELTDYQSRLQEQETQQAYSSTETVSLTERLKSLKSYRDQMIILRERSGEILDNITQFHRQYRLDAQMVNRQLEAVSDPPNLRLLPLELDQLDTVSQILSANIEALQTVQSVTENQISETERELGELQGIDRIIAQLRRTIDGITSEIEMINARIDDLRGKEQSICTLDSRRVEEYAALVQNTIEQRSYLQRVIDQFETDQDDLLTGLSFSALVDTSIRDEYVSRIAERLDGRAHAFNSVNSELSAIIEGASQQMNSRDASEYLNDTTVILPLVQQLRDWATGVRLKRSTMESEFFNALFSPFFRIGLHIEFNDRPLEVLSMGERAVVLLKILLGLDDKPLLIDQPDEHLDNRYIYDELTPAFRSAKSRRQIIIATHNANLVVNTDAEQIILAECSEVTPIV